MKEMGTIKTVSEKEETWIIRENEDLFFLVHPLWSKTKIENTAEILDIPPFRARVLRDYHLAECYC